MALLFFDGFETVRSDAQLSEMYAVTGVPSVTGGRGRSAVALYGPDDANNVRRDLGANYGTIIIGCAMKRVLANEDAGVNQIALFDQAGGPQVQFRFTDASGGTVIASNASNSTIATSSGSAALQGSDWFYFEAKVVIGNSGSIVAKVDGVEVLNATGIDTMSTANANVRYVQLGTDRNHTGSCQFYYDDWYVCDTSGTTNNDFLGPVRVDPLYLDGDGTHEDFTPSTGTNSAAMINELEEGTSDYIEGSAPGDKATFGIQPPPEIDGAGTVFGVMLHARGQGNGVNTAAGMVRSGSSEATGTAVTVGSSATTFVHVQQTDPATGALWTEANLLNAELGITVVA